MRELAALVSIRSPSRETALLTWMAPRVACMVRVTSEPMDINVLHLKPLEPAIIEVCQDGKRAFITRIEAADAMRLAAQFREMWWTSAPPTALEAAADASRPSANGLLMDPWNKLSRRELEVVSMLAADHLTVGQLARKLGLSVHTARNHVKAVYRKVDCHHMGALISRYLKATHAS